MKTRYFSLVIGIVFLAAGIIGFIPNLVFAPAEPMPMRVGAGYGLLLGLFPVNVLHNVVHLVIGLWGVLAWRGFESSRFFAQALCVIYAALAIIGLFPQVATLGGVVPLYGNDVWLHAAVAVVAAYFGFATRSVRVTPDGL